MKSYDAAMNKVWWRMIYKNVLALIINVMINLNIVNRCRDFLHSLNAVEAAAVIVGLCALNGLVLFAVLRFLRIRRDEKLRQRLMRMQIWEIVKADRQVQQAIYKQREREKVCYGRQDI